MKGKRIDIRKILADSHLRRELMIPTIQAIQAREGVDTTREQAEWAYDAVQAEKMDSITFETLNRDGMITNIRVIKQADIEKCPRFILVPEHYKKDGSCYCFDPDERARVLAERQCRRVKYEGVLARQAAQRQKGRR